MAKDVALRAKLDRRSIIIVITEIHDFLEPVPLRQKLTPEQVYDFSLEWTLCRNSRTYGRRDRILQTTRALIPMSARATFVVRISGQLHPGERRAKAM